MFFLSIHLSFKSSLSTFYSKFFCFRESQVPYGAGHICSGVLISNYTVLTTASCLLKDKDSGTFYGREELTVAMGNLNRFTQNEAYTFNSEVTAIKTHGRFNKRTYANNLAILEVRFVTFNLSDWDSNIDWQQVNSVKFGLTVIPVLTSSEKVSTTLDCHVLGWKTNYVSANANSENFLIAQTDFRDN